MNTRTWRIARFGWCIAAFLMVACATISSAPEKPNVVLIFVDDMGYGDAGCYGNAQIKTPNIDRLAASGTRFTEGYVASSVCGPSRTALLSGAYSQRFGVFWNPDTTRSEIPFDYKILPEMMGSAGYATCVIGKWNITRDPYTSADSVHDPMVWGGNYWPDEDNIYRGVGGGWGDDKQQGLWGPLKEGDEYLTDRLTQHAVNFIEENAGTPFFIYLAYNAPHSPLQAQRKYKEAVAHIDSEPMRLYAAMVMAMDAGVGRVLDTLEQKQLRESTLVVFLSDNGPAKGGFKGYKPEWPQRLMGSTGGLRGNKGNLYEGGIRIPYILSWPGHLKAGAESDMPVTSLDLFPTFAALAGAKDLPNPHIDGMDLMPYLQGGTRPGPRPIYWASYNQKVVREGDWKLVVSGDEAELFNLRADRDEERNLARQEKDRVKTLTKKLEDWLEAMPEHPPKSRKPIIEPEPEKPLEPVLK
jgi:arylsulfatase A-like enzyme